MLEFSVVIWRIPEAFLFAIGIKFSRMPQMFRDLRNRHPVFTYRSASVEEHPTFLRLLFDFHVDPHIRFNPAIDIPWNKADSLPSGIEILAFHLGLVELISYWKATCSPLLRIEAGPLSSAQGEWWIQLMRLGLGEFCFKNGIDPSDPSFVKLDATEGQRAPAQLRKVDGDLILVGGGKDSSLALELLKRIKTSRRAALALNPIRSAVDSVSIAGLPPPLVVKRQIDPALLELNKRGYLNGHTPFSAYLAFLGSTVAALHGFENVIVANEQSANEQNTEIGGISINHQYSKTYDFEARFRNYSKQFLLPQVNYFSFLRPIHDVAVSRLFVNNAPQHLRSFRSCNVGQKEDRWCGQCPKCAFVYLTLLPFLGIPVAHEIFGSDLFKNQQILSEICSLCGLSELKPFECVGTAQESREAVALCVARYQATNVQAPEGFLALAAELKNRGLFPSKTPSTMTWSEEHFLPPAYRDILHAAMMEVEKSKAAL